MLQLVHSVAPAASLSFATAFNSESSFAQNILDLRTAGADVIVDDISYFAEPFFQEGPVANAVATVTAAGASYISSAGNRRHIELGPAVRRSVLHKRCQFAEC